MNTKTKFKLNPQIAKDTSYIANTGPFQIRLMLDKRFFWLLVIPEIPNIIDWHDLKPKASNSLNKLISDLSHMLKVVDNSDKINVASIGNIVPQFHLHIISRHKKDPLWPKTVWGVGKAIPLSNQIKNFRTNTINSALLRLNSTKFC